MSTYDKKLSKYYDLIYSSKDYLKEANFILKHCPKKKSLIDVGCGTFNHSLILSNHFEKIVGVDTSSEMLKIAKLKTKDIQNVSIINKELEEIDGPFTCAISMFNVINHIHNINGLYNFFGEIGTLLNSKGTLIFDCWNGVACTVDPPKKHETREINVGNTTIKAEYNSETDVFNSKCEMNIKTDVYQNKKKIDNFEYTLTQTLWTPKTIIDILNMSEFKTPQIYAYFTNRRATQKDYRITFVVTK